MLDSPAIRRVRHLQARLCRDFLLQNVCGLLNDSAVADTAQLLVERYFPRAVKRENSDNLEMLSELYRYALVLGPLLYRIPGDSRLDWHVGTELSWFRRCITKRTQQWYFASAALPLPPDPSAFVRNAFNVLQIRDADFLKSCAQIVCNLAASGGRKSLAAQRFSLPVLGADFDAQMCSTFHTQSNGLMRRKYRAQGAPVGSYLRKNAAAFLLVDGPTRKRLPPPFNAEWRDIREQGFEYGDYRIEWDNRKQSLRIRLHPKALAAAMREVRLALDDHAAPAPKFKAVMSTARAFFQTHQYATDSLKDLQVWNQRVAALVRKSITAAMPSLSYEAVKPRVYSKLVLPIGNPFRTASIETISDETWMSIWSPFR